MSTYPIDDMMIRWCWNSCKTASMKRRRMKKNSFLTLNCFQCYLHEKFMHFIFHNKSADFYFTITPLTFQRNKKIYMHERKKNKERKKPFFRNDFLLSHSLHQFNCSFNTFPYYNFKHCIFLACWMGVVGAFGMSLGGFL